MNTIHLNYRQTSEAGQVTISASIEPIESSEKVLGLESQDAIQSAKSPRDVIEMLEQRIVQEIDAKPGFRDALEGNSWDSDPEFESIPRRIGYSIDFENPFDESDAAKEKDNSRRKIRNAKLLKIYRSFVDTYTE